MKIKNTQMEPTRAKARGFLGGMPKRPILIRTLKGAVCWPRGIKVIKGRPDKFAAGPVVRDSRDFNDADKVRRACAMILAQAGRRGRGFAKLSVPATAAGRVGVVASAKIAAQEVFRHVREAKRPLRNIVVVGPSGKIFKTFRTTLEGYLKHMTHKICRGPFITVDAIIEISGGIVLIKRSNPPFGWAIPGGFVDYGESLEKAVAREAKEETSLVVRNLKQMHTYSDPTRDPRFHTVTTVFVGQGQGRPRAASDAQEAKIFKLLEWRRLPLAFDHRQVLEDYLKWKASTS